MKYLALLALLVMLPLAPARAEIETYEFDKVHTQVMFFVSHLGFSISEGEFHDFDGLIEFNRSEPEKSKVDVTIQTNSIDMDDDAWDKHMKSADFFNVEEFPAMTFKSTSIKTTGEDTADIMGDLTILGVTKPVVLKTKLNKAGKHPMGDKYAAGFSATTKIKRSDFGMEYGLPMVGDDVDIRIEVEAVRTSGGALNP